MTTLNEIAVRNPADGRVVGRVPDTSPDAVQAAVGQLREHQPAWEALGPDGRARWVRMLRDWLLDHDREVADTLQSETGKVRAEAALEAPVLCDMINYWCARAATFLGDEHPRPHGPLTATKRLTKSFRPYPVVGVITPWNYPLFIPGMDTVPALLAGAAVVVKPSEVTPLSARLLARAWDEIGAPPVLAVATGLGATGAAVVDSVDYVQFTGSTATGKRIAAQCVETLTPYSLELGGKDPAIVLADADLERAANAVAWGGLLNAGQTCISIERVYVEEPVYDEFVGLLIAKVTSLRQGLDDATFQQDVGALANEAQLAIVTRHVRDARERGARVATGGLPTGEGTFFRPTILLDVDHSMACMREETFGPTLPVMKVSDVAQAISLANDSPYGLSASVFTRDRKHGEAIARQLDAGAVNINDVFSNMFNFPLPHSGWKQSGVGARLGGSAGLRKYCRAQAITSPRIPPPRREPLWYPYSPRRMKAVGALMRAVAARDPLRAAGVRRRPRDGETR